MSVNDVKKEVEENVIEEKTVETPPKVVQNNIAVNTESVSEEDIKKSELTSGVKAKAVNSEGLVVANAAAEVRAAAEDASKKAETEVSDESEMVLPRFFVKPNEFQRIEVDILFDKTNGKVLSISKAGMGIDFEQYSLLGHTKEWVDFTQPTYEELSTYRQRSAMYNSNAQKVIIDNVQMRNFMIVWHLKDWSLRDDKGNKIVLEHDTDGSLKSASMDAVYKTFPTFIDVVLTVFEKDILLA